MNEQEILEHRYRFFSEMGTNIAVEQDKLFVSLFTGIIAGLIVLVIYQKVGFLTGICFLISTALAVKGLAFTLLHMSFTSKLMLAYAALFTGEEFVPNIIEGQEKTENAIQRVKSSAQRCYSGELLNMFFCVLFAGLGLIVLLWEQVKWIGIIIAIVFFIFIALGIILKIRNIPKKE